MTSCTGVIRNGYVSVIIRVTENSVSTIEFYRLFLTKSNGICWDICWKMRQNNNKNFLFLLFLKDHTISTKTYYFKEWTTILHYQHHKTFTIFYYLYMSALCLQKLNILHYKHFINLSYIAEALSFINLNKRKIIFFNIKILKMSSKFWKKSIVQFIHFRIFHNKIIYYFLLFTLFSTIFESHLLFCMAKFTY